MASEFWKGVWAELTGSAQHRRDFLRIKEIVLRDASARIRAHIVRTPPTGDLPYDNGYADAMCEVLKLIDPDFSGHQHQEHP